jgi:hypothetical protein
VTIEVILQEVTIEVIQEVTFEVIHVAMEGTDFRVHIVVTIIALTRSDAQLEINSAMPVKVSTTSQNVVRDNIAIRLLLTQIQQVNAAISNNAIRIHYNQDMCARQTFLPLVMHNMSKMIPLMTYMFVP